MGLSIKFWKKSLSLILVQCLSNALSAHLRSEAPLPVLVGTHVGNSAHLPSKTLLAMVVPPQRNAPSGLPRQSKWKGLSEILLLSRRKVPRDISIEVPRKILSRILVRRP
mmetsp:Transcript_11661/g.23216  ORF Transcript_11661/g.23216 Transcript_11661/m.23216 type:complete len:110 (-) Transcript_11661:563-892(-)